MGYFRIALFALALSFGVVAQASDGPDPVPADAPAVLKDWRKAAREDIEAAYSIFAQHHPGMFDPQNPGFPEQLKRARDTALAFAEHIDDAEGHFRALERFSAVLADGHATVGASYSGKGPIFWPGFRTEWRGSALYVVAGSDGSPPRGSALKECDGIDAQTWIRKDAFIFARPDEEGQWWGSAPSLFIRSKSHYETLPRECSFTDPDGSEITYRIDWRPMPKEAFVAWGAETQADPIGLTEPRAGIELITLSSFNPGDEGIAQYARLSDNLAAGAARLARAKAIVIDLRGNHGGSDYWAERVAGSLWGADAVDAAMGDYFRNTQVWVLADDANIAHFREIAAQVRQHGRADDADRLDRVADRLEAAHARGERFDIQDVGPSWASEGSAEPPRDLPPVYVIVSGDCVSACLDAVDMFTRFPKVKLVGAPTSADSAYLDIRDETLPSGRGFVVIPTRIWVNRPRAPGQIYHPDIPVNDLDWSTATMLDHIERDLNR